jgi:hypothetical protein
VVRSPEQLRLHRALKELGWTGVIDELNDAAGRKNQSVPEPILIATDGTILAGFGRWRLAVFEGTHKIHCIEYPLSEDDSLIFILTHHQTRRGWNAFVRIRLALKLEPYLHQRALDNMRAGGKYKGLANLPDAQRIDVREEIANAAGGSPRYVGKRQNDTRGRAPATNRSLARRHAIDQSRDSILQVAPGRTVGAVHLLHHGMHN